MGEPKTEDARWVFTWIMRLLEATIGLLHDYCSKLETGNLQTYLGIWPLSFPEQIKATHKESLIRIDLRAKLDFRLTMFVALKVQTPGSREDKQTPLEVGAFEMEKKKKKKKASERAPDDRAKLYRTRMAHCLPRATYLPAFNHLQMD